MKNLLGLSLFFLIMAGCSPPKQVVNKIDWVSSAIEHPSRSAADKTRDARSRPDVTLAMLEIGPGDVVFDVFGGGGYYSELIARIVGEKGQVYLHNNQAYRSFVKDALKARMENNKMAQLIQYDREVSDLGIPTNSADAALIIMSYHDLFVDDPKSNWPLIDHQNFIQQIHDGLKKGGRFMIVDHHAKSGSQANDSQSLHRIEKAYAIQRIEAIGFKQTAESDVLSNSADDKSKSVFDPEIRGKSDRFILVFEKL